MKSTFIRPQALKTLSTATPGSTTALSLPAKTTALLQASDAPARMPDDPQSRPVQKIQDINLSLI